MKTVIMQPYFFPYLGYWQMILTADTFVIFDDVNFIKRGWINRNNILINGSAHLISLPLLAASQNKHIKDIWVTDSLKDKEKLLKTIEVAYKKAPFFNDVFPIVYDTVLSKDNNLARLLRNQFESVFNYLDVKAKVLFSSDIDKNEDLRAQDKIIDICKRLNTTHYINAIGGTDLYDRQAFANEGMKLSFIKMRPIDYKQFNNEFVPNLSFIDVLMFNSRRDVGLMLNEFDLID